ncbi:hypothetical protein N7476_007295 [Penicillium atrosanguineum]|uniref:Uncharacterized protein n=1 Tax=Penicillium atrosanguineum TaxID=1132637 RepID=A0A9W9PU71_9EURO|nr:hypothetical protein N7526_006842 [Penicillium atrosanguineum]KAJ5311435.1 hypothetical protein N7476_007295 [Penicillium atrosanguineum]
MELAEDTEALIDVEVETAGETGGTPDGEDPDAEGIRAEEPAGKEPDVVETGTVLDELGELLTDCNEVEERVFKVEETAMEETAIEATGVDWGIEIVIVVGAVNGVLYGVETGVEEAETELETGVERTKGVEVTEDLNGVELATAEGEGVAQVTVWRLKWISAISISGSRIPGAIDRHPPTVRSCQAICHMGKIQENVIVEIDDFEVKEASRDVHSVGHG